MGKYSLIKDETEFKMTGNRVMERAEKAKEEYNAAFAEFNEYAEEFRARYGEGQKPPPTHAEKISYMSKDKLLKILKGEESL